MNEFYISFQCQLHLSFLIIWRLSDDRTRRKDSRLADALALFLNNFKYRILKPFVLIDKRIFLRNFFFAKDLIDVLRTVINSD